MDYITIIQGDDTNFLDDQFLVVNFKTNFDLSGFSATFTLGDVTLNYGNLNSKIFEIILSNEITSNLSIGKQYGELKLIDKQNRIRTVTSIIPFLVKKGVNEEIKLNNTSLNVSMNINNTSINIIIETSGISKTEAERILNACSEAKQSAQNSVNNAQTLLVKMDSLSDLIDETNSVCTNSINEINRAIALATNDIDKKSNEIKGRIETAQETINNAQNLLENLADKDLYELSQTGEMRLFAPRFCFNAGAVNFKNEPNNLIIDSEPPYDTFDGFGFEKFIILNSDCIYTDGFGKVHFVSGKYYFEATDFSSGKYSVRIKETQNIYLKYELFAVKNGKVFRQIHEPSLATDGDLWQNLSTKPYLTYKKSNFSWVLTDEVEIGILTIDSSSNATIKENKYNIADTTIFAPDYSNPTNLSKGMEFYAQNSGIVIGCSNASTTFSAKVNNMELPIGSAGGNFSFIVGAGDKVLISNFTKCSYYPFIG